MDEEKEMKNNSKCRNKDAKLKPVFLFVCFSAQALRSRIMEQNALGYYLCWIRVYFRTLI